MSLFALGAVLFVSGVAAAQSQHMSKTTGPGAYVYMSGSMIAWPDYAYFVGNLSLSTSGTTRDPMYVLSYGLNSNACDSGGCNSQVEIFRGPIPRSSVSYSGRPRWNGAYQVVLNVDTSVIDAGGEVEKVGNGGLIQLTLTQDPNAEVSTLTGEVTWEDSSGKQKQTGSQFGVPANITSAYIWMNPVPWSSMETSTNLQWMQFTNIK